MVMYVLLVGFTSKRCCFMMTKIQVLSLLIILDRNGES